MKILNIRNGEFWYRKKLGRELCVEVLRQVVNSVILSHKGDEYMMDLSGIVKPEPGKYTLRLDDHDLPVFGQHLPMLRRLCPSAKCFEDGRETVDLTIIEGRTAPDFKPPGRIIPMRGYDVIVDGKLMQWRVSREASERMSLDYHDNSYRIGFEKPGGHYAQYVAKEISCPLPSLVATDNGWRIISGREASVWPAYYVLDVEIITRKDDHKGFTKCIVKHAEHGYLQFNLPVGEATGCGFTVGTKLPLSSTIWSDRQYDCPVMGTQAVRVESRRAPSTMAAAKAKAAKYAQLYGADPSAIKRMWLDIETFGFWSSRLGVPHRHKPDFKHHDAILLGDKLSIL